MFRPLTPPDMDMMPLGEIAQTEMELVSNAPHDYGKYFEHAQYAVNLLHSFIKSSTYEAAFFLMFFAAAEKHIVLGALSGIRMHHVQANFNFRYATEAGAWAAYALAHPDPTLFADAKDDGTMEPTKDLKMQMYAWLDEKYPAGSASLKRFKDSTNALSTHANIVDVHRNFGELKREKITTSFFDQKEEHHIQTDLWTVGNLTMGLLDIFYGVNRDYPQLVLKEDFLTNMDHLRSTNDTLKAEMKNHPRFKKWAGKDPQ